MKGIGRRDFLKIAGLGAAAMCGRPARAGGGPGAGAARKPNILFILADDLRPDGIHALGNPIVRTPNLDGIVERGFIFRNAYTMGSMVGAVCLPSRTMILTGRTMFHAQNRPSGNDPASFTFPRAMRHAGYAAIHAGKYGNSPGAITKEFDETHDAGHAADNVEKMFDFVRRNTSDPAGSSAALRPMFMYLAGKEPHDPQHATQEFYEMYKPCDIPLPPNFLPQHPFDNGEMTVRDEQTLPWPRTLESVTGKLARYYASISCFDAEVGRLIRALKDAGQYDNTIFVIAGDNGLSLGEHGLLGKQNLYEFGGMHVPLVFAGPGVPRGETAAFAYLFDVFPTVCELAGAPIPAGVEGKSLASVMQGRAAKVRDHAFTLYKDVQRAVRDERWKLIRYPKVDKTQLFDLKSDPREMNNFADNPEHGVKVREMMALLEKLQAEYDDHAPLRVPNPQPSEWTPPVGAGGRQVVPVTRVRVGRLLGHA